MCLFWELRPILVIQHICFFFSASKLRLSVRTLDIYFYLVYVNAF